MKIFRKYTFRVLGLRSWVQLIICIQTLESQVSPLGSWVLSMRWVLRPASQVQLLFKYSINKHFLSYKSCSIIGIILTIKLKKEVCNYWEPDFKEWHQLLHTPNKDNKHFYQEHYRFCRTQLLNKNCGITNNT